MMGLRLPDKVAIITGACGGIGMATTKLFLQHGARVALVDVNNTLLPHCSRELEQYGDRVMACSCDVAKDDDVVRAVQATVDRWGFVDIIFNNAGISGSPAGVCDAQSSDLMEVISTNVGGTLAGTREVALRMRKAGKRGCIINCASACANMGGIATPLYTASKAAIIALTKSSAHELAPFGIRVNAISPAATPNLRWVHRLQKQGFKGETAQDISDQLVKHDTYKGPPLTTDMVAQAALFLADDSSGGYLSGHNLIIDGGLTSTKSYDPFLFMKEMQKQAS